MTEQPEALQLADALEAWTLGKPTHHREAATELRRLHALNGELLEALRLIEHATAPTHDDGGHHEAAHDIARAAIARAEGQA